MDTGLGLTRLKDYCAATPKARQWPLVLLTETGCSGDMLGGLQPLVSHDCGTVVSAVSVLIFPVGKHMYPSDLHPKSISKMISGIKCNAALHIAPSQPSQTALPVDWLRGPGESLSSSCQEGKLYRKG